MPRSTRGSSILFWTLAISTIMCLGLYTSVCLINLTGTVSDVCPVLEMTTIVLVLAFVLVMFWYCFKLQTKAQGTPSNFVVDPASVSTETVNNVRYTCASPLMKSEYHDDLFETVKKEEIPEDFECAVCSDGHEVNHCVVRLKCNHDFHKSCIVKWFQSNKLKTCPVCRTSQLPANRLLVITILPQVTQRPYRISQI